MKFSFSLSLSLSFMLAAVLLHVATGVRPALDAGEALTAEFYEKCYCHYRIEKANPTYRIKVGDIGTTESTHFPDDAPVLSSMPAVFKTVDDEMRSIFEATVAQDREHKKVLACQKWCLAKKDPEKGGAYPSIHEYCLDKCYAIEAPVPTHK
eukprot:TRINITY_DN22764_c0_g1_i1.p1 TRINITY_DN22764_c0_g1~~TRINITY_DN22764_c0_g1_i1.p1  ORF type:complete len:152 (+),score=13.86 TRINITY_DN22764_c0_g1_i1:88-543(+)